ncbi:effector-associated domain EAD1-containing protein [Dictyobacter aurantiacus]|uniref:Effector-associated domain-containing protein n=1 Tax=Dictyobacter aurantiacus TaxID=1936993 RepID=A0A401ZQQ0_9CHLR|nr:effector-associated domain EAD1-containing protein [Dictyobacter aurantiacus]GCE09197.1 hypothetical protein KDAU_65260 [Dictyobacter aurantiacus]
MDDLSKDQLEQLLDILGNIFTSKEKLGKLLRTKLDIRLNRITNGTNMDEIIFTLIENAESEGWLDDFITATAKEYPKNHRLQQVYQQFCIPQPSDQSSKHTNAHVQIPGNTRPSLIRATEEASTPAQSFHTSPVSPQQSVSQIIPLSAFSQQQQMSHQAAPFSANFRHQWNCHPAAGDPWYHQFSRHIA